MTSHSKPLILVVAASTTNLGIGKSGGLPWRLKNDMSFFSRITKRTSSPTTATTTLQNAVIMGRKTYLSIPPKFRPLPGRLNVVLSRAPGSLDLPADVLRAGSIEEAVAQLEERDDVERVFVIGGAEIYKAALEGESEKVKVEKVVLTRVENEVECDAFFPVRLEAEEGAWERAGHEALEEFVGEEVPRGAQEEGEWRYGFELWQKRR